MPTINGNKLCVVCQQWKPATPEFFYNRTTPKGTKTFGSKCRECDKAIRDTPENKAKALERQRKWREKNHEHYIAHKREYENQTREYHNRYTLQKYHENRDVIIQQFRERYKNDMVFRASKLAQGIRWRKNNQVKYRIMTKSIGSRSRAKGWGVESTLTSADIFEIFEEQNGRCFYCGITLSFEIPKDIHTDHVTPFVKGGSNTRENVVCACADCNQSKAGRTLEQWQKVRGW